MMEQMDDKRDAVRDNNRAQAISSLTAGDREVDDLRTTRKEDRSTMAMNAMQKAEMAEHALSEELDRIAVKSVIPSV